MILTDLEFETGLVNTLQTLKTVGGLDVGSSVKQAAVFQGLELQQAIADYQD